MWVETDCNLVSGESLVRQILFGKSFFAKELGYETKDVWIPDVFGYASFPAADHAQVRDRILPDSKNLLESVQQISAPYFFWRESMAPASLHTSHRRTPTTRIPDRVNSCEVFKISELDRATRSLLVFGWGDGGGGPSIEMLEKARRARDFDGLPQVQQEEGDQVFRKGEGRRQGSARLGR